VTVATGIEPLIRDRFLRVARKFETLSISEEAPARLEHQRDAINAMVQSGVPVCGLWTGFGALSWAISSR